MQRHASLYIFRYVCLSASIHKLCCMHVDITKWRHVYVCMYVYCQTGMQLCMYTDCMSGYNYVCIYINVLLCDKNCMYISMFYMLDCIINVTVIVHTYKHT